MKGNHGLSPTAPVFNGWS